MHVYFKGLKFIRFAAASLVVIHHIEQFKTIFGMESLWHNGTIRHLGDRGVTLFFVLSGFLITYLLLKEKEQTKTINIKNFYIRRMLRIWPLYFLIVLTSIFVLPNIPFFRTSDTSIIDNYFSEIILLSIVILPNVIMFKYGVIPFASQTWSIGVEEQFYLLWPLLIKYVKRIVPILVGIIITLFVLQNFGIFIFKLGGKNWFDLTTLSNISHYFKLFRIDSMAFGSLGAVVLYKKHTILNVVFNPIVSALILLFTICLVALPVKLILIDNVVQSLLFTGFILNSAANEKCFYTIENKITNLFGDISYGMYMYHSLVCYTVIKLFGLSLGNIAIYILCFLFTLVLAYLSYILFEKRLINVKAKKFAVIKSN
ncbi:MAG: acyltransferase [Bacteroidetes bacterium]|nr:acyltransferase [Bacteroidota bacterium]